MISRGEAASSSVGLRPARVQAGRRTASGQGQGECFEEFAGAASPGSSIADPVRQVACHVREVWIKFDITLRNELDRVLPGEASRSAALSLPIDTVHWRMRTGPSRMHR